jgi:serine acetyltransferase
MVSFVRTLREDIRAVFDRDPAARSTLEVLLHTQVCMLSGGTASRIGYGRTGLSCLAGCFRISCAF